MNEHHFQQIQIFEELELKIISEIISSQVERITNLPLKSIRQYHLSHSEYHHLMAPKSARQFSRSDVGTFLSLPGFVAVKKIFCDFDVGDVVDDTGIQNVPEVYFRLVRPSMASDIGMPHCDHWFHKKFGLPYRIGSTYKLWIAVCAEPTLNGLCFYPSCNFESLGEVFFENNRDWSRYGQFLGAAVMPMISTGEALLFRDDVVHGGALNRGTETRCSIEITFVPR